MTDELGLYLPSPPSGVDARRAKNALSHLLNALDHLSPRGSAEWTLSELKLASLSLAIAPSETLPPARRSDAARTFRGFIDALRIAAEDAVIPTGWPQATGRETLALLRTLGPDGHASLYVRHDGEVVSRLAIDDAVISGLARALSSQARGFGTVTGHLRELEDGQSALTARLVRDDGREVVVEYREDQVTEVIAAWRHHRVEVTGQLLMDVAGEPTRVTMDSIDQLPEDDELSTDDVSGGFYPSMAGGMSSEDYLRLVRGQ